MGTTYLFYQLLTVLQIAEIFNNNIILFDKNQNSQGRFRRTKIQSVPFKGIQF